MSGALDVLVVDDRPDTVRALTEFLLLRCRQVDVAASVKEAMAFLARRGAEGASYHAIFSDVVMPGVDGLSFLRELRMRGDDVPFVFITGYRSLNPKLEEDAARLGVIAILDKPIELRQIETLLAGISVTGRRKREDKQGGQPFFGTSRVMRRSAEAAAVAPSQPSDALERRPQEPVALPPITSAPPPAPPARPPQAPPPVVGQPRQPSGATPASTRFRRGVEPMSPQTPAPGPGRNPTPRPQQPATTFTARIRRGVEGTASFEKNQGTSTESGKMVSCTQCGRSFLALAKPIAYTTVCVHCGQMQRIDPS